MSNVRPAGCPGWLPGRAASLSDRGVELDGCDLAALAAEHGTPLWLISRRVIESNYATFVGAMGRRWPGHEVAYSMKAHNSLAVVRLLSDLGALIDCSSVYELEMALSVGVPGACIVVNGNGKTDEFLRKAIEVGARQVNVDSLDEALRLDRLAGDAGARVTCLVRLQLGYGGLLKLAPHFANRIRVGRKFGASVLDGSAEALVAAIQECRTLDFEGYHHHVGFSGYAGEYSREEELAHHVETAREVCEFAVQTERKLGAKFSTINLGGGFRPGDVVLISKLGSDDPTLKPLPTLDDYCDAVGTVIDEIVGSSNLRLQFETGNFQIANAVVLLVTVQEVKDVREPERRRIVTVDAGGTMMTLRGSSSMGFPVCLVSGPTAAADNDWPVEIVGQSCVYDTVEEHVLLPVLKRDDLLAVFDQGAYCEVLSTQFNAIPRPAVCLLDNGAATIVKRRETLDDILIRELEFDGR